MRTYTGSFIDAHQASKIKKAVRPSTASRRVTEKALGKKNVTDQEIEEYCDGWEWRDVPEKLTVMDFLISDAWRLVHRLMEVGVKFAGTPTQATLVIAGTAYAAWRYSVNNESRNEPAERAMAATGLADGVWFALWNKEGIPLMHAGDFADAVAQSDDPIDKMTPMVALATVWPHRYSERGPELPEPTYMPFIDPPHPLDDLWNTCVNVLTAAPEELRAEMGLAAAQSVEPDRDPLKPTPRAK